jgi:hypothetical protein
LSSDFSADTRSSTLSPTEAGGVWLTLRGVIVESDLEITAEHMGTSCKTPMGYGPSIAMDLQVVFGAFESEPAFGRDGYFTEHPEALDLHRHAAEELDAERKLRRADQEGRYRTADAAPPTSPVSPSARSPNTQSGTEFLVRGRAADRRASFAQPANLARSQLGAG